MLLRRRHRQFQKDTAPSGDKVQPAAELPKGEEGSTEDKKKKKKK